MKKIAVFLLCFLILFAASVHADEACATFADGVLTVEKNLPKGDKVTLSVIEHKQTPSSDKPPVIMYLYSADDNGLLLVNIPIVKTIPSGRYDVIIDSKSVGSKVYDVFIYDEEDSGTSGVLDAVRTAEGATAVGNALTNVNTEKIGFTIEGLTFDKDYVSKYIYSKAGSYTKQTFTVPECKKLFETALVCEIISLRKDADSAIRSYPAVLSVDLTEYASMDKTEREILLGLLESADYTTQQPEAVYKEMQLVASAACCTSWAQLKTTVADASYALNMGGDYAKVKEENKYLVFSKMLEGKDSFDSLAAVGSAFDKAVAYALDKQNETKKTTGSGSGASSAKSADIVLPAVTPVPEKKLSFSDIENHFCGEYVDKLAKLGVISGYEDNTFRPDAPVTRAEFSKMVCAAFGIDEAVQSPFNDVKSSDWFCKSVCELSSKKIIFGFDGFFRPADNIKRQDAAVILQRILNKPQGDTQFDDISNADEYAVQSIKALAFAGVISGDGKCFNPQKNITRAETAVMLCKALAAGGAQ